MKCIVFSLLAALTMVSEASARLGETLDECVQRYGPMIERRPARLAASDPEVMVFSKSGITVTVEFHEGRAWHLMFRKATLTGVEVEQIILANAGAATWGSPFKTKDKEYRLSNDKKRVAVINWDRKTVAASLVVMSKEFADANYVELAKKMPATDVPAPGRSPTNPLPGF